MRSPGRIEFLEFLYASDVEEAELGVLPGTQTHAIQAITQASGATWSEMVFDLVMAEASPNIFIFIGYAMSEWQRYERAKITRERMSIAHRGGSRCRCRGR